MERGSGFLRGSPRGRVLKVAADINLVDCFIERRMPAATDGNQRPADHVDMAMKSDGDRFVFGVILVEWCSEYGLFVLEDP